MRSFCLFLLAVPKPEPDQKLPRKQHQNLSQYCCAGKTGISPGIGCPTTGDEHRNESPNPDFQNHLVVWIDRSLGKQTETPVYLSLAQKSGHPVLNRMLDKMGMERALSMAERYDQQRML